MHCRAERSRGKGKHPGQLPVPKLDIRPKHYQRWINVDIKGVLQILTQHLRFSPEEKMASNHCVLHNHTRGIKQRLGRRLPGPFDPHLDPIGSYGSMTLNAS